VTLGPQKTKWTLHSHANPSLPAAGGWIEAKQLVQKLPKNRSAAPARAPGDGEWICHLPGPNPGPNLTPTPCPGGPRDVRGHTSEVLDIKHLARRWGCLETQQRVMIKCWQVFEGSKHLGVANLPQPQAPRSRRGSPACTSQGAKLAAQTQGGGFARNARGASEARPRARNSPIPDPPPLRIPTNTVSAL